MRYAYYDLGDQPQGSRVVVGLKGRAANVILLDEPNFRFYRGGAPFFYSAGGQYRTSPVQLAIPADGKWFLVVDLGGYSGWTRATVEIMPPEESVKDRRSVRGSRGPRPVAAQPEETHSTGAAA